MRARILTPPLLALAALGWPQQVSADEGCNKVRMSDIGWTDVTSTSAVAGELLRDLGYESRVELLSLPVTFVSLKNGDIDVFLGNWMPGMTPDIKPYLEDGSVVVLGKNLEGALFTFAVPKYVYDAGVTSAIHLDAHKERFNGRIYGIEPGSNGIVLGMIAADTYGLNDWTLVESSEQGMLGAVSRATSNREWIVFLGWKPHPMNTTIEIAYLADPLEKWGPGGGASVVYTVASKRFVERCPNLVTLFRNLKFTVEMESSLMSAILHEKKEPAAAARAWLSAHPEQAAAWTRGVAPASVSSRAEPPTSGDEQVSALAGLGKKLPVGTYVEGVTRFVTSRGAAPLRSISDALTVAIEGVVRALLAAPPWLLIAAFTLLAYALQRRVTLAASMLAGCLLIWNLGYWQATIETLVLVVLATTVSVLVGVPVGIAAAHRPRLHAGLRLVLDLMQTVPTFVYLIPTLMLFGLGLVPGLLSTVIFALPAPIRLTHLGITRVPRELLEAGDAFGAKPMQRLLKIELPHARSAILEGVTQALMLSLSMVVIAALVGAGGLGAPVVRALNTVNIGQGFEAGLTIVIVAILLDRTLKPRARRVRP